MQSDFWSAKAVAIVAGFGIICSSTSFAQQRPAIPSTAQPTVQERQLEPPPEPKLTPDGTVSLPIEVQVAPPNSDTLSFTLRSLNISGSHVFPAAELTRPYSQLIGQTVTVAKIYAIANALTARYRNAGFILSSVVVPTQSITDGDVRLLAVEGYIANISLDGAIGNRSGLMQTMRERVLADRPLQNSTLERFLLLLNDLPGTTAQSVLRASATPGASDLIVRLRTVHVDAVLSGSNRGSKVQGPDQFQGVVDFNSILGLAEGTTFQYLQASPVSELRLYSFSNTERLTASGLELKVSGSHSDSNPTLAATLASLNLATNTTQGRIGLDYPALRERATNLSFKAAMTYSDSKSQSSSALISKDIVSAVRLGFTADHSDSASGVNTADFELSRGINAFGASPFGDPDASVYQGRPDFTKVTLYLARLQSLTKGFSALFAVNGQYAFNHLLLPEEFAYGGEYVGRAYDPSEIVGDSGTAEKLEIRYTREFGALGCTVYVFGEDGEVWTRRTASNVDEVLTASAVSVGGGLRWNFSSWISGYVEGAKPTNHVVAADGNKGGRLFAGLQVSVR